MIFADITSITKKITKSPKDACETMKSYQLRMKLREIKKNIVVSIRTSLRPLKYVFKFNLNPRFSYFITPEP